MMNVNNTIHNVKRAVALVIYGAILGLIGLFCLYVVFMIANVLPFVLFVIPFTAAFIWAANFLEKNKVFK